MGKIVLVNSVKHNRSGMTISQMQERESYRKLVEEANQKIDEGRRRYATAYKKATTYLAH